MEPIIKATDKTTLKNELKKVRLLKESRYGNQNIYEFNAHESEILMNEVGRAREISFRHAGGGTGKPVDIDSYDVSEESFKQLIIWSNDSEQIVGGYRYQQGKDMTIIDGQLKTPTGNLFKVTPLFHEKFTRNMIELGRSFVIPDYQVSSSGERKGIFVLENLWVGLGAVFANNPHLKYCFGKFTMYTQYDKYSRDLLLNFLHHYFYDNTNSCKPINPVSLYHKKEDLTLDFTWDNYNEDYKKLSHHLKEHGTSIPPLVNSYMNLSPTMKVFGTSINDHFGGVEETAIMINIDDIKPEKLNRYGLAKRIKQ